MNLCVLISLEDIDLSEVLSIYETILPATKIFYNAQLAMAVVTALKVMYVM